MNKMKYDDGRVVYMLQAPFLWRTELRAAAKERGHGTEKLTDSGVVFALTGIRTASIAEQAARHGNRRAHSRW